MVAKKKTTRKQTKKTTAPKTKIVYRTRTRTVYKEAPQYKTPVDDVGRSVGQTMSWAIPSLIGIGVAGALGNALK